MGRIREDHWFWVYNICCRVLIWSLVILSPVFVIPVARNWVFTPCLVSGDGLIGFGARGYMAVIIFFLAFSRVFLGWGRGAVKYIGFPIGLGVFL